MSGGGPDGALRNTGCVPLPLLLLYASVQPSVAACVRQPGCGARFREEFARVAWLLCLLHRALRCCCFFTSYRSHR